MNIFNKYSTKSKCVPIPYEEYQYNICDVTEYPNFFYIIY